MEISTRTLLACNIQITREPGSWSVCGCKHSTYGALNTAQCLPKVVYGPSMSDYSLSRFHKSLVYMCS